MITNSSDPAWQPPPQLGDFDRGLAQFLGTISPEALDAVAQQIGDNSPIVPGDDYETSPGPVRVRPGGLAAGQKQMISSWVDNRAAQSASPFWQDLKANLDAATITITSSNGCGVEVAFTLPGEKEGASHNFTAFGESFSAAKLDEFKKQYLKKRLSARPLPAKALLGAQFAEDGTVAPSVQLEDPGFGMRTFKPSKSSRPIRGQFLLDIADTEDMNVVADFYSVTDRMLPDLPKEISMLTVLQRAAKSYQTVFKQTGDYLLARRELWPDDDIFEPPAPLPQTLAEAKERGDRMTIYDMAVIAALSGEQLCRIAAYNDGNVNFGQETRAVKNAAKAGKRPLLVMYAHLAEDLRKAAESKTGVALSALPAAMRNEIVTQARMEEFGPPIGSRLRVRGSVADIGARWEVLSLEVITPRGVQPRVLLEMSISL